MFLPAASIDPATVGAWSDFPAYTSPRPLVLLGDGVIDASFDSAADSRAYNRRRWDVAPRLPATPAEAGTCPVIRAVEASDRLRDGVPESPKPGRRLEVTDVRLETRNFETDRGPVSLPAWIFHFRGADSPGVVAAVAEPALYLYPMRERIFVPIVHGYQVSSDGRTVTVVFQGIRRPGADSDPATPCRNRRGYQALTFPLLAPLGGRPVVDDPSGTPLRVIDAGSRSQSPKGA